VIDFMTSNLNKMCEFVTFLV